MASVASEQAKWALLLCDIDGCTLVSRSSALAIKDGQKLEISQIVQLHHGKEEYKAQVLALSDNKRELNAFECEWEESSRAEAIELAKNNGQEGGYLDIPELNTLAETSAISEDLFSISGRVDDNYVDANLMDEIQRLRDNQEKLMANNTLMSDNLLTVMAAVQDVRSLLQTRLEKASQFIRPSVDLRSAKATVTTSSTQTDPPPPLQPAPEEVCPTAAIHQSNAAAPIHFETMDDFIPPPTESDIAQTESDIAMNIDFSVLESLWQEEPLLTCPILETEETATFRGDTSEMEFETPDAVDFEHVPCPVIVNTPPNCFAQQNSFRPISAKVNIGTARNLLLVDSAKYRKAVQLPSSQRVILALMDLVFGKEEMAESSVGGGLTKYKGTEKTKKPLCPGKLKSIFRHTATLFDVNADDLASDQVIRNAINSKCRGKQYLRT